MGAVLDKQNRQPARVSYLETIVDKKIIYLAGHFDGEGTLELSNHPFTVKMFRRLSKEEE